MDETITIKQAAEILNLSYGTVYAHKLDWGFFKMAGSRVWRVGKNDLAKSAKKQNNVMRPALLIDGNGGKTCRSTSEKRYGGLMYARQVADELDNLLAPKTKN